MTQKQEIKRFGWLLTLWIILMCAVLTQSENVKEICANANENCQTCISANWQCSWCTEVDEADVVVTHRQRCATYEENLASCKGNASEVIQYPLSKPNIIRDDPFTVAGPDFFNNEANLGATVIQMKPQEITLKLRPGHALKTNITFHKAIDYPLDLYYVMDLSFSMADDLLKLQSLGTKLFSDIKENVTQNVQLGFGSFVDKVMMPFASTVPAQLDNPCVKQEGNESTCAPAFGFRHQVNITSDSEKFAKAIRETEISGNIDSPEGSFDALMQIAVCDHIQWRKGATHVVLLTTDATPHFALDGKLAAILEANDMNCHMEWGYNSRIPSALLYSKSKSMDYPSLGQLKNVFSRNRIHSIFAVTDTVVDLYEEIKQVLDNSYVAELKSDSSNIIPLIASTYNQLKRTLTLSKPNVPSNVQMSYRVLCPNATGWESSLECTNVDEGDDVIFEFTFDALSCPSVSGKKDVVKVQSSSIQDEVTINIEYVCECDCSEIKNSSKCTNQGDLTCGICDCDKGRAGSVCQCDATTEEGLSIVDACRREGRDELCEGHGRCECGKCVCDATYFGKNCECKTTGCPDNGGVCGGPDKGDCMNCDNDARCECKGNYTLKATDKTCTCHDKYCKLDQNSDVICNGQGICDCETCICSNTALYAGTHCETCIHPNCTDVAAECTGDLIKQCAFCLNEKDRLREKNNPCTTECGSSFLTYEYVDEYYDCDSCVEGSTTQACVQCSRHSEITYTPKECKSQLVGSECDIQYKLAWLDSNEFIIYIKNFNKDRDCPAPIDPVTIVLPVIGTIIVIGLVLLAVWKAYITLRDKRQYEEFLKEEKNRKWTQGQNPLYEKSSSKITNPAFVGEPE